MKKIIVVSVFVFLTAIFIGRTLPIIEKPEPIITIEQSEQIKKEIIEKFESIDKEVELSKTKSIPIIKPKAEKKTEPIIEPKETLCKEITFDWLIENRTTTVCITQADYEFYLSLNHGRQGSHMITEDNKVIQKLSEELKTQKDISAFVRENIEYITDSKKYGIEYPQYPIETLWEKSGDCEDTSYLVASLLRASGYDVVLITFTGEGWGHMAVGIAGDYTGFSVEENGKKYFYLETTSYQKIGRATEKHINAEIKIYK